MESHGTFPKSAADSEVENHFKMIDVGEKPITARRAIAEGRIQMARSTLERIQSQTVPKGNVLALAEIAGIHGAKRTSDLLPLCHPLPLESVRIHTRLDFDSNSIWVSCEARVNAKTGVEMEALSGASAALLCIYDLTKGLDPEMTLSDLRLILKEGGKSGRWEPSRFKKAEYTGILSAVITISDRCSQGEAEDRSGPVLEKFLKDRGAEVGARRIIPDDLHRIQSAVCEFSKTMELILLTGGTGIGPRDQTPEALAPLWTKKIPGIGERLRSYGAAYTDFSWLSRSEGGLVEKSLVILLPGSSKAVLEGMTALENLIPHLIAISKGASH